MVQYAIEIEPFCHERDDLLAQNIELLQRVVIVETFVVGDVLMAENATHLAKEDDHQAVALRTMIKEEREVERSTR
ncbi:hypothetical protein GUJ93_ZPchr0010g9725 [Zizania palustris]|uniref:Uncharacterized protein n=1 Tax=Zizania palustris TaxID=103762 RepID=A0A8J6BJD4_ZIZPA|nr:hypothetical protein GUJ93_ZPchr0010g9725 [Zizania palustris]